MNGRGATTGLLKEVAEILGAHGYLRCAPTVETVKEGILLTVLIPVEGLEPLEVATHLEYLSGLCQVRAFAQDYGMDGAALEKLLPKQSRAKE